MGFADKKVFDVDRSNFYTSGKSYDAGVFGDEDYFYAFRMISTDMKWRVCLTKYTYGGTALWTRKLYTNNYNAGAGLVTPSRIYFLRASDNKVGWIENKDDIGDYPTFTPILSAGSGEGDLQGLNSYGGWTATLYKNSYIFHVDCLADRILVTDLDGNYKGHFGTYGSGTGQLYYPSQCAFYGDYLFIADMENKRITVWKVYSVEPFNVQPLGSGGISGLPNKPKGVGTWKHRKQLYVVFYEDRKIREYEINDDLTLVASGNEVEISSDADFRGGMGMIVNDNHVVGMAHYNEWYNHYRNVYCITTHTAIHNTMDARWMPVCDALSFGIENSFSFSIHAGQQGVWKPIPFSITSEGRQQIRNMNASFGFSCHAEHEICAIIASFSFSGRAEQRQIKETIPFSFLGHSNFMMGSVELSLDTEIISNVFLTGENIFTFEMIANSPLTYSSDLSLEVPKAEGTLINDAVAYLNLALPELVLSIQQAFKVGIDIPIIQPSGELASPILTICNISLHTLQVQSSIDSPHSFSGQGVLSTPSIIALLYQPDLLTADITLSPIKTNGIAYEGADYAEMELITEPLTISSQLLVIPVIITSISLPALEIDAHEGGQIASIEEIYKNSILTVASGDYPQVEGVELLGIAINLLNNSISKIANTEYMIIDMGYLDLHKGVVNQYLEVFISGYTPNQHQSIGELIIGDYTYLIEEWVTENEWRVLVGKGLTRKTAQNADKRFIPIRLKLKPDFELRSVVIRATPVARRRR